MKNYVAPGKTLPGMAVTDNIAVGLTTLNQLQHFGVKSPWHMAKTSRGKLDPTDQPFKDLREIIQRAWDVARSKRADLYCTYIDHLLSGTIVGGTPPITLYVDKQGTDADGEMSFPYTAAVIAIDGETQLEARYRLADKERKPDTADIPFAVTIYHGISETEAMQILHDFNHFAKPIPESKLGMRNASGGMSQTISAAAALVPGATLNTGGAMGTKTHAAGYQQAMFFIAGYAIGQPALEKTGSSWFDALNVPGSPPVNGACEVSLAEMLEIVNNDLKLRQLPTYLWQAAGVLASEGRNPQSLSLAAGLAAYKTSSKNVGTGTGKGGSKGKTKERLHAIYTALKS
jgi:hypothetical protein